MQKSFHERVTILLIIVQYLCIIQKNKVNRYEIDNKALKLINILIYGPVDHLSPKKHIFLEKSFEKYF